MLSSELKPEYDVIVVGARVAGAAVAALLGDAGREVLLVDAAALPSPTLSTHFFRGGGMVGVLDRLGVLDQVLALGSPPLVHEYFYPGGGEESMEGPSQNPGVSGTAFPSGANRWTIYSSSGRCGRPRYTSGTGRAW